MKIEKINVSDLICIFSIIVGSIIALLYPEHMEESFNKTIIAVALVKLFW
jgi:hypothetical protein